MTDPVQLLIDAGAIPSTPFAPQSRYNGVALGLFQRRDGEPGIAFLKRRFIPAADPHLPTAMHIVSGNDRPDTLGARYLGDPLLYWHIADANAVVDPNEMTDVLGRRVSIPQGPAF